jgi:hypothetical protein
MQPDRQHMLTQLMAAQPEAVPLLRRFFVAHATRDWAAEVPEQVMEQAKPAMRAMHRTLERGDHAEALAQPCRRPRTPSCARSPLWR